MPHNVSMSRSYGLASSLQAWERASRADPQWFAKRRMTLECPLYQGFSKGHFNGTGKDSNNGHAIEPHSIGTFQDAVSLRFEALSLAWIDSSGPKPGNQSRGRRIGSWRGKGKPLGGNFFGPIWILAWILLLRAHTPALARTRTQGIPLVGNPRHYMWYVTFRYALGKNARPFQK